MRYDPILVDDMGGSTQEPHAMALCDYSTVLLIENSGSCAGKWLYNNRLSFCSREFTTLKGIIDERSIIWTAQGFGG